MPPMMAITYLAIRAYPICWLIIMISRTLLNIEICGDNMLAITYIILAFNAIMFNNHFKYFDLHQKIFIVIPLIYYILLSFDKVMFNMFPNNQINPILGVGLIIVTLLSIIFDLN